VRLPKSKPTSGVLRYPVSATAADIAVAMIALLPSPPMTHFSPYRPTPFGGMWFAVEGGTLVIGAPDA
jgi:hypothetical protein